MGKWVSDHGPRVLFIIHRYGRNPLQQVSLKGNAAHGAANPPPMLRMDTPALAKGGYTLGLVPIAFYNIRKPHLCIPNKGPCAPRFYPPFSRAGDRCACAMVVG